MLSQKHARSRAAGRSFHRLAQQACQLFLRRTVGRPQLHQRYVGLHVAWLALDGSFKARARIVWPFFSVIE